MFEKVRAWFMNLFSLYKVEEITGVTSCVGATMKERIDLWADIFGHCATWNDQYPSCGVLESIYGAIANAVGEEIKISTDNETTLPVLEKLDRDAFALVAYMVGLGASICRPVFSNGRIQYEIIPLGNYLPTSYDFDGTMTGCIISRKIEEGKNNYLLCEVHKYENKVHYVETKLYRVKEGGLSVIPLTSLSQTKGLTESYVWQGVDMPMVVEFRNKGVNKIDGTKVPTAMIAGAEKLIELADKQFYRINWEQEGGEMKVFADADLFRPVQGKDNKEVRADYGKDLQRLFVKINGDVNQNQKLITHAPTLRTVDQSLALQEIFKRIEQSCNVGRGTISDLEQVQQTATQFTGGKKAFYSVVDTIESELEEKYRACAYVFAYMASAYMGVKFDPEIKVEYNDMVRKDPAQMKQIAMQEKSAGLLNAWEYRAQFYGETEEEAKANVPVVTYDNFGNSL